MTTGKAVVVFVGIWLGGCTALNPSFGDAVTDAEVGEGGTTVKPTSTNEGSGMPSGTGGSTHGSMGTVGESDTVPTTGNSQTGTGGSVSDTSVHTSSGAATTTMGEVDPAGPPCVFGVTDELPTLCYDFEEVEGAVVSDHIGDADLTVETLSLMVAPPGWGQGLDCSAAGCAGTADGFEIGSAYTIEVWARLTELDAGEDFTANLVRLVGQDTAGFEVRAGKSLELWLAATVQTTFRLISDSRSLEYFCVALQWEAGSVPTYSAYDAGGALVQEEALVMSPTAADLSSPTLVVGNAAQPLPVQIIGLRVWDRYVATPCAPPGVP